MTGTPPVKDQLQSVHVRVTDRATGKPTPCRISFVDEDGVYYAPYGRLTLFPTGRNEDVGGNVRLGRRSFAYIDGSCEINLPPGELSVEIVKGPEYRPFTGKVTLALGKLSLRFELERALHMTELGWHSGDTRVHFLSPHAALLEAQAEDVRVVNLLVTEAEMTDRAGVAHRVPTNVLTFSGQAPLLSTTDHIVVVNTFNEDPDLGSLALLHCHRVVYPLTLRGAGGTNIWTLADLCDQCHRKKGLVVWSKTAQDCAGPSWGEPLADLLLGKVDAFEMDHFEDSPFDSLPRWYTLLEAGLRVPIVGASGKDSNVSALGVTRTYARLLAGQEFSYRNWIEAVRSGRTFVSNGPLLEFTVNGEGPSTTTRPLGQAHVAVRARCLLPLKRLELICNGEVIDVANDASANELALDQKITLSEPGWLAVRVLGDAAIIDKPANQRLFAHSSPVYFANGPATVRRTEKALLAIRKELDLLGGWAASAESLEEKQREALGEVVHRAGSFHPI